MDIKQMSADANKFGEGVDTLIEKIKADYATFSRGGYTELRKQMIAEFNNSIEVIAGRKYIKIVSNGSVWGFIIIGENDKQFRRGDILKAAGWNAPARNFARGNILEGNYKVHWTGAM